MTDSPAPRVFITGIGLFSPLGIGADAFWSSLSDQKSGIGPITIMEASASPRDIGGEVKGFDEKSAKKEYISAQKKNVKVMCRDIQLGVASAVQALDDSGLDLESVEKSRMGVDFGANLMLSPPDMLDDSAVKCVEEAGGDFQMAKWGDAGLPAMVPLWLLKYLPNMPACHISIIADAQGPSNSLTLDEASAGSVMGEAQRILQRGQADIMITGTTGTRVHPVKTIHAALWDELADSDDAPETWARPFASNSLGQVVAEGAGTLILESEEHATARGATIYGELLGTGSACVLSRDGKPDPQKALVLAMQAALRDANLTPDDIGHVNANGLGVTTADRAEAAAIHEVFGERGSEIPVTALKSYFGNAGSGCGIQEVAGSLLALRHGVIPATLNCDNPDPECNLNIVCGDHQPTDNNVFLSINITRMGQASAVVIRSHR